MLVIFQYTVIVSEYTVFASKIATLLSIAQTTEKFLAVVQARKSLSFSFLQFYDAAKATKKCLLKLTEHLLKLIEHS